MDPNEKVDLRSSAIRSALRLDSGSEGVRVDESGFVAHFRAPITPEDESEPLAVTCAGGTRTLVWSGRLDNRDDLAGTLGVRRNRFPITDSSIVAAALEKWGDDVCEHLLGDFALVCWNHRERQLLLASDHTANRAIFYSASSGRIAFSTSVSALLGMPGIPRDIDQRSLARTLLDFPPERGCTMFRHIKYVPAATQLIWSQNGISERRYWAPRFQTTLRYANDSDYVDHARELLDEAVRCRLRVRGTIVSHLSGGLDSTAVTATAARLAAPARVLALTAVSDPNAEVFAPPDRAFGDETEHAAAVARMYCNIEHRRVPAGLTAPEPPEVLFYGCGIPIRNLLNVDWFWPANRMAFKEGARAVLIGSSGNLTLSWAGQYRLRDLVRGGNWVSAAREALAVSREQRRSLRQTVRSQIVPPLVPGIVRRAWRGLKSLKMPDWRRQSAISLELFRTEGADLRIGEDTFPENGGGYDASSRQFYLEDISLRAPNPLFREVNGFEMWDPLADIRLVEFCLAIPAEQYFAGGIARRLARRTLADRLPESIVRETRRGRQSPEWFHRLSSVRKQMADKLQRLSKLPQAQYALDFGYMQRILDAWPADAAAAQEKFSLLVRGLARGVNVAEFLEWVEHGCPPAYPAHFDQLVGVSTLCGS